MPAAAPLRVSCSPGRTGVGGTATRGAAGGVTGTGSGSAGWYAAGLSSAAGAWPGSVVKPRSSSRPSPIRASGIRPAGAPGAARSAVIGHQDLGVIGLALITRLEGALQPDRAPADLTAPLPALDGHVIVFAGELLVVPVVDNRVAEQRLELLQPLEAPGARACP